MSHRNKTTPFSEITNMKKYAFTQTFQNSRSIAKDGKHYRIAEIDASTRVAAITIYAEDEVSAIREFSKLAAPAPPPRAKTVTKRQLAEKLNAQNLTIPFLALLATLPPAEKLLWDASPTISSDYPFIKENRDMICAALGITAEQFDNIFR